MCTRAMASADEDETLRLDAGDPGLKDREMKLGKKVRRRPSPLQYLGRIAILAEQTGVRLRNGMRVVTDGDGWPIGLLPPRRT